MARIFHPQVLARKIEYNSIMEHIETKIENGDCLDILKNYPDNFFNLIVTSPPYADSRKGTYGGVKAVSSLMNPLNGFCQGFIASELKWRCVWKYMTDWRHELSLLWRHVPAKVNFIMFHCVSL
jgi:DNA modification methylase